MAGRLRDEAVCASAASLQARGARRRAVVYVGDGYSDRCAALAAERIFARDGLARHLDAQGVAYERFDDLHDVASALT